MFGGASVRIILGGGEGDAAGAVLLGEPPCGAEGGTLDHGVLGGWGGGGDGEYALFDVAAEGAYGYGAAALAEGIWLCWCHDGGWWSVDSLMQ